MAKRTAFEMIHDNDIVGKLTLPDRVIFKGHLGFRDPRALKVFLGRRGVLLKDFGRFAEKLTARIKKHAQRLAHDAGRPYRYLQSSHTARSGYSKEQLARDIAERDGITDGLVCVLAVLEACSSFDVRPNHQTHRLEVVRRRRKCLHFYFYFVDPEYGWMHVRLQSWLPLQIQIYVNGREWLCRQLDKRGIGYERYDNALVRIDDLSTAQRLAKGFSRRRWPRTLDRFARLVNPFLLTVRRLGFGSYFWVVDQCEIATDVMFTSRAALHAVLPGLIDHSMTILGAEDALRFLGRKPHGNFRGQATVDLKKRPEGYRVKFRMKRNTIKMYDKFSVLRIETTINNPREFRVLRVITTRRGRRLRAWKPMNKGVANFWRYVSVGEQANARYLESLGQAQPKRQVLDDVDHLSRSRTVGNRRIGPFNPVAKDTARLFAAALVGNNLLNGFRNSDIARGIYPTKPSTALEARRRRERVSRLIRKMRDHHLVAKVPRSRLYRLTPRGHRVMGASLRFRKAHAEDVFAAFA